MVYDIYFPFSGFLVIVAYGRVGVAWLLFFVLGGLASYPLVWLFPLD